MLSRPLTLNDSDDRGRGLVAVTPPPVLPLVNEGDDNGPQTGFFSPSWSSSPSSPPPPPCGSSSSSSSSSSLVPSLTCPSSFLSFPSSSIPPPLPRPSVSFMSSVSPVSPPLAPSLPSTPAAPPSIHPAPPSFSSPPASVSVALSPHDSSPLPPPLPPASCISLPPPSSATTSPLSSSAHIHPSLISPPVAPPLYSAPPPALLPPPCCPCSSLLHRLLSAHRLEVRRLLRGAVASLGRRLDSLERRSRRKRRKKMGRGQRGGGACSPASTVFTSSTSSCSPAPIPLVTTASSSSASSDSDDMPAPPLLSSFGQSEQRRGRGRDDDDEEEKEGVVVRGRKRRRKTRREQVFKTENREEEEEEEEEEEDGRRFIGQMAVSVRGGGGGAGEERLTLQNFNQKKHKRRVEGGVNQSEKSAGVVIRQNGFRTELLLHSVPGSSSHDALRLLQLAHSVPTCSQSVAVTPTLTVSSGQWRYSDFAPPRFPSTNRSAFRRWLPSSSFSFRPAPMLRLSVVAMETLADIVKGGSCGSPLRPLKDWTAPPSLSSDHCYVRSLTLSSAFSTRRQQKQRANHSTRSVHLPRRRALPLPPCSANGLSDLFPASQSATSSEFLSAKGERAKRVSQIRIRRASPRETPLTPMGLPKVKRLKKKEFSLEEIYTNKNYKSPTSNRSLETIFEEPREKDGALLLIGQQRRRRLLLFPDFTQPRKRKRPQGVGLPVTTVPRKRAAARRHCHGDSGDVDADLDVMLVERLSALEDFLTRQGLDV